MSELRIIPYNFDSFIPKGGHIIKPMNKPSLILVIDDDSKLLMGISEILKRGGYEVITANNGTDGIQLALENSPSLIISDMMMPPPDGPEVLRVLSKHESTIHIPFIFLTARTDERDKVTSLKNGADDYITKPFSKDELLGRVNSILRRKGITENAERYKQEDVVNQLNQNLIEMSEMYAVSHEGFAAGMSRVLSLRDKESDEHSHRVVLVAKEMAKILYQDEKIIANVVIGALLHDVGKIAIPDAILLKPSRLTDEEYTVMKTHAALGREILETLGLPLETLQIAGGHHERWDGGGYPQGLSGTDIPLPARLFAVVDVWDALANERAYRQAWSLERTIDYIKEQSGKHFDPAIVKIFLSIVSNEN